MNTKSSSEIELILGTAQLTENYGITRSPNLGAATVTAAIEFLEHAYNLGIRTVDTAPSYGDAEKVLGESQIDFEIHTKIKSGMNPIESIENSLTDLQRKSVGLVYIHDVSRIEIDTDHLVEQIKSLKEFATDLIGFSLYSPPRGFRTSSFSEVDVFQVPVNALDRRFLSYISTMQQGFVIRSVFLQGLLVADLSVSVKKAPWLAEYLIQFKKIANSLRLSQIELALYANLNTGANGIIVGAQSKDELSEIVEAWNVVKELPATLISEIEFPQPKSDFVDPREWSKIQNDL